MKKKLIIGLGIFYFTIVFIIVILGVIRKTPTNLSQAAKETLPGTSTHDSLFEDNQPTKNQTPSPTLMGSKKTTEHTFTISGSATLKYTETQNGYPSQRSKTPVITSSPTSINTPIPTHITPQATITSNKTKTPTSTQPQATASRTNTLSPTLTQTPSHTPTSESQTGWEGDWMISFEKTDGSFLSGTMTVNIVGSDLSASAELGGDQYSLEGIIYYQVGEVATGSWNNSTSSGYFWWINEEEDQFRGSRENHFAFCGARTGDNLPEPCLQLPPR